MKARAYMKSGNVVEFDVLSITWNSVGKLEWVSAGPGTTKLMRLNLDEMEALVVDREIVELADPTNG